MEQQIKIGTMAVVNLTQLTGKDVFTKNAKYVGKIDDPMIDTEKGNLYGFIVGMSRNSFLYQMISKDAAKDTDKKTILIPYREILSCDDIVIVTVPKQYEKPPAASVKEEDLEEILPTNEAEPEPPL